MIKALTALAGLRGAAVSARVDGMTAANMAAIQDGLAPEYSEPHFQEKAAELAQLADDLENAMNAPGGEE